MTEDEKIKIEPEFNRALDLWHEDKPFEAIKILKQLNKEFPNQPTILGMLGAIHFTLDDWANSLIYYDKAVILSPKSESASIGLFHSLWHHERFDEAFEEAKRYVKLNGFSKKYDFIMKELDENGVSD